MSRVFIVRPFNVKEGVNFEAVDAFLIQPALKAAGEEGATTTNIAHAGNIREDMFRLLVTADLVIADVSIHNANVFYELGVRHGLRPRGTLLIRAAVQEYPFDLQTDRFLLYDPAKPQESVPKLTDAIKATLGTVESAAGTDSPVYKMLPRLPEPSPTVLRVVPQDFREAVDLAEAQSEYGDLRLLAHEAAWFEWGSEGLRTVGRAQFNLKAWQGARDTFESLRKMLSMDVEANQRLATIYQKLGDLDRSNQAIRRILGAPNVSPYDRAEAFALQGRNAKTRWLKTFERLSGVDAQKAALRAAELKASIEHCAEGFEQDLNHFYSGLNALSLLQIRNSLATSVPEVWEEPFELPEDAARELSLVRARFDRLANAVEMSMAARETFLEHQQPQDTEQLMWAAIGRADHAFLTGRKPAAVATRYREALATAPSFGVASARGQLEIFQRLGVRSEFVEAALAAIDGLTAPAAATAPDAAPREAPPDRVLLFTGHMVDDAVRKTPRFPRTPAAEAAARAMIKASIDRERQLEPGRLVGVAGGACGGDILFHEVCEELGIETRLLLALPQGKFSAESVQHGDRDWVERYNRLCYRVRPRVLADEKTLPAWLIGKADYQIWSRNNLWMLFNALALNARSLTLIALWDKGPADGPGGTKDLVELVTARGHKVDRLPAEQLAQFV